ncbi:MAG TPA: hypothetical protein VJ904_00090, partial [Tichowtungia sp.]|nr:hypothetical protein [Tichowtungia sp.]
MRTLFLNRPFSGLKFLLPTTMVIGLASCSDAPEGRRSAVAAPVETAPVEKGVIRSMRTFSGSLEAYA